MKTWRNQPAISTTMQVTEEVRQLLDRAKQGRKLSEDQCQILRDSGIPIMPHWQQQQQQRIWPQPKPPPNKEEIHQLIQKSKQQALSGQELNLLAAALPEGVSLPPHLMRRHKRPRAEPCSTDSLESMTRPSKIPVPIGHTFGLTESQTPINPPKPSFTQPKDAMNFERSTSSKQSKIPIPVLNKPQIMTVTQKPVNLLPHDMTQSSTNPTDEMEVLERSLGGISLSQLSVIHFYITSTTTCLFKGNMIILCFLFFRCSRMTRTMAWSPPKLTIQQQVFFWCSN